jgi:hypothetical protein
MHPLRLPDDIEVSTNNQFCFILQNSGQNNYSLNVKALDDYDIAKINPHTTDGTAFMNTSGCIKENEWYNIVAKISENEITAELQDTNGTVLENFTTDAANVDELVILLADNTDRAVAFKNLNVETLNQPAEPTEGDKKAATGNELLAPNAAITILLATVFAAVVYMKKRKRAYEPALNENHKR